MVAFLFVCKWIGCFCGDAQSVILSVELLEKLDEMCPPILEDLREEQKSLALALSLDKCVKFNRNEKYFYKMIAKSEK
jgi:hypothetical protein